jgi:hypothetical protein
MDIVTVTCQLDSYQMIQQAESISLFVKPCTHWVIVNDVNVNLEMWEKKLAPYYKTHKLNLKTYDITAWPKLNAHFDGYYIQQILKLLISKEIKDDYLLLDSKNLFLKEINIENFRHQTGDGRIYNFTNRNHLSCHLETIEHYASKLNIPVNYNHLNPILPFVINYEVMKQINNLDQVLNWFSDKGDISMSEFLLYSSLCQKYNYVPKTSINPIKSVYFWNKEKWIHKMAQMHNIDIVGFHRQWINNTSTKNITRANKFLRSLGFTHLLKRDNI